MIMTIEELLKNGHLLFDGGMGTAVQKLGLSEVDPPEMLNLKFPSELEQIHKNYIEAGSDVVETNTFGASRTRLKTYGLGERVAEINIAAVNAAKSAAGEKVFVAGSVGPLGELIEPFGDLPEADAEAAFGEQINILLGSGVDIILIETMISLDEALIALRAAKNSGSKITGVTMTYEIGPAGAATSFGESPEIVVQKLRDAGADFTGANCGQGFDNMLRIAHKLKKASELPLLVQPNAGLPEYADGQIVYKESPEKFAGFVREALDLGVEFVGGCCGTNSNHIRAAKAEFDKRKSK